MNHGINLDDTMCLIHSITQLKTHNLALQARIKELEAQVKASKADQNNQGNGGNLPYEATP